MKRGVTRLHAMRAQGAKQIRLLSSPGAICQTPHQVADSLHRDTTYITIKTHAAEKEDVGTMAKEPH